MPFLKSMIFWRASSQPAPSIRAAKIAAFFAPLMAAQATEAPEGICTTERRFDYQSVCRCFKTSKRKRTSLFRFDYQSVCHCPKQMSTPVGTD